MCVCTKSNKRFTSSVRTRDTMLMISVKLLMITWIMHSIPRSTALVHTSSVFAPTSSSTSQFLFLISSKSSVCSVINSERMPTALSSSESAGVVDVNRDTSNHTTTNKSNCCFELFDYCLASGCDSWYNYFIDYISIFQENIELVYHKIESFFMNSPSSQAAGLGPNPSSMFILSHLSCPPSVTYYLYALQTLLFRTETVALVALATLFAFLVHHRDKKSLHLAPSRDSLTSIPKPSYYCCFRANFAYYFNFSLVLTQLLCLLDAVLLKHLRSAQAISYQLNSEHAAIYSIQGRRPNMEDCFTLKNNIADECGIDYYAVYDGHGGPVSY